MEANIIRSTPIERSARVMQLEGMFDVPPTKKSEKKWTVRLPIEDRPWNIGLIVGPSGCGKSTIARELFGDSMVSGYDWPAERSIVDAFPEEMGVKDITGLLSSVGFSSPPAWLRPFGVLSNGEQFRATLARALAESPDLAVIDEFTSVVDRTVAQVGSAAAAKAVRARKQKLIAVSCHYDIVEWLQPDWQYEPASGEFSWRLLRRRPDIEIEIIRVRREAWKLFKHHHYLSSELNKSAQCFVGLVRGQPAAFTAVIYSPGSAGGNYREHRTVCLPDFQGVGIGNAMSEFVAGLYQATGKGYTSTTSSPSMMHHRARSKQWSMRRKPSLGKEHAGDLKGRSHSRGRLIASFRYLGPPRREEAKAFGLRVD
jgi:GTPase SAR1 family protein